MAPWRSLVCVSGFGGPPFIAHEEQIHDLLSGFGSKLGDPWNRYAFVIIVSEFEVAWGGHQKIAYHFVIDFDVGDVDGVIVFAILFD